MLFRRSWIFTLLIAFSCYFLLNYIGGKMSFRWDLTEEKIHSIAPETANKLRELKNPVTIRYYVSKSENTMPYDLRVYSDKAEYFLGVLERASNGKIEVIRSDPKIGSDAEKSAKFDGIVGSFNREQNRFYLGLSVSCLQQKMSIPFLHPDRGNLLEYDILEAIGSVTNQGKKTVGILSSLPVFGGESTTAQRTKKFPAWLFIQELRKLYKVVDFSENPELLKKVNPDLLVLIHPMKMGERIERQIDQHLASGGKMIVMLDPYSASVEMINPQAIEQLRSSHLNRMLKSWGIYYNPNEVVADMFHRSEINRGFGPETSHTAINITQRYIHKDDPVTAGISKLSFPYAGHFLPLPESAKSLIPLVTTSAEVNVVQAGEIVGMNRDKNEALLRSFKSDNRRRVIIAKLMGGVTNLFPETNRTTEISDDESQVILFADADFVFDPFAGESVPISSSKTTIKPYNDNFALFSNAVDFLIGEKNMRVARGKGAVRYPLAGLADLQASIEKKHQEQRAKLSQSAANLEKELSELRASEKKEDMKEFMEHEAKIKSLLAKQAQAEEETRELDFKINLMMQGEKNKIQWLNSLVIPVAVFLICAFVIHRRHKSPSR